MSRAGAPRGGDAGPDGLLLVDKPVGPTSFDVIRRLRRATGVRKFGHAGTLDPMASGLLPVLVNRGTRLVPYLMAERKVYLAEVRLGWMTDTDDAEGQIVVAAAPGAVEEVGEAQVRAALAGFVGELEQVPPRYSALKIDGRRAYDRARAGEAFEMTARSVHIYAIDRIEMELPFVRFEVECGKGTYIRTLAADLGNALGCYGHLSALRRTRVGAFDVARACALEALEDAGEEALSRHLVPLYEALEGAASALAVDAARAGDLVHGRTRFLDDIEPGVYRVAHPETGVLLAIVERELEAARATVKVFV